MVSSTLLSYNIRDIGVRYNMTHGTISAGINIPTHQSHTEQSTIRQRSEPSQLQIDSSAFYASIGIGSLTSFFQNETQQGRQAVLNYIGTKAGDGEYLNHIEKGHNLAQLYRQKHLSQATRGTLVVKKAAEVEISFTPASVSTEFIPMKSEFTWDVQPEPRKYTPPDFGMTFTQWPSVTYDYNGRPRIANPQTASKINLRV